MDFFPIKKRVHFSKISKEKKRYWKILLQVVKEKAKLSLKISNTSKSLEKGNLDKFIL